MTAELAPVVALVGYQWDDSAAAELLHEELAMRGLTVIHDRCTFTVGTRLTVAMNEAVERCDAYVPYLSPRSLYETAAPGSPRPALDNEFIPLCHRRRTSQARGDRPPKPVIGVVTHGLGNPHTDAAERVRRATGEDIASLWSIAADQSGDTLSQADAAQVAASVLAALLPPGGGPEDDRIPVVVTTRGAGQPPRFLTVDATPLLGGDRRAGAPEAWHRFLEAIRDVERVLARATTCRALDVDVRTHLTGAIAFGRVFNQVGRWRHHIDGRSGSAGASRDAGDSPLEIAAESYRHGGPLLVDLDLIGHDVSTGTSEVARRLEPAAGRLHADLAPSARGHDLGPDEIVAAAGEVATAIRDLRHGTRCDTIHLFVAAPASFGVLLGAQLTALATDLVLYERSERVYEPVLTIPADVP